MNDLPVTMKGLEGSVWARRAEAERAMTFFRAVQDLAGAVQRVDYMRNAIRDAVDEAREEAVEAVMLWRTAVSERRRLAMAEARARRTA